MISKTAIIVITHNQKELTDSLCRKLIITKSPYDLFVIETGSKLDTMSSFATFWVKDGIRMTRGFNWGIRYALWKEKIEEVKYDSFWLVVNDSFFNEEDVLTPLVNFMRNDKRCGCVHPFVRNSGSVFQRKKEGSVARKESFVEIVCPLLSRKAVELNLLDDDFYYGWGLDYEIPYLLHKNSLALYIHNQVGVTHQAGTTVRSGKDECIQNTKQQFDLSRDNMMKVLLRKYGDKWGQIFLNAIPEDVPKDAFVDWVQNIGQNYRF